MVTSWAWFISAVSPPPPPPPPPWMTHTLINARSPLRQAAYYCQLRHTINWAKHRRRKYCHNWQRVHVCLEATQRSLELFTEFWATTCCQPAGGVKNPQNVHVFVELEGKVRKLHPLETMIVCTKVQSNQFNACGDISGRINIAILGAEAIEELKNNWEWVLAHQWEALKKPGWLKKKKRIKQTIWLAFTYNFLISWWLMKGYL